MNVSTEPTLHEQWMAEAVAEAELARGRTRPNPLVGCVIVRDGQLLGRGHHARAGGPHAEVAALRAVQAAGQVPLGADAYINLEPCCHQGRTGPCSQALIEAGIRRVFIGTLDPFPAVSGGGVAALRRAGVEVHCGVLAEVCERLNRPYFKRIATGIPWVNVKYALTLDGKIASAGGDSAWISSEASRHRVHQMRNTHDAILVGTGTLLRDNPRLTCRLPGGRDPMRVVLDARLRAPLDAAVFQLTEIASRGDDSAAQTLVVVGPSAPEEKRAALEARGVQCWQAPLMADGRLDLRALLQELGRRHVMSVLVEGGSHVLGDLFDRRLVDEVHAFVCPRIIGGAAAPSAVAGEGIACMRDAIELEERTIEIIDGRDVLIRGVIPDRHRADVASAPARALEST